MPSSFLPEFQHSEAGLTRFPPNVEQITIAHETTCSWLIVRRNDQELRLPLYLDDCDHLAALLLGLGMDGREKCKKLRGSA